MLSSDSRVERAVSVSSMRSTKVPLLLRACLFGWLVERRGRWAGE